MGKHSEDMWNLKQLFCNHFGCYMVIAGSNTFYMKIEDKNKFSVTSWISCSLGRYLSHSLFDKYKSIIKA